MNKMMYLPSKVIVRTQKIYLFLILILLPLTGKTQELYCVVNVDVTNLEGTSYDYVKQTLKSEIENYINNYRWTEIDFKEQERINCQMNVVITSGDQNFNFSAESIISARRPIYNTMTETNSLITNDQSWQFSYPQGKSLIHDELIFDGLTSFIDYYMYVLLGFDFDSFSPLGGTPYFEKAQNIVDLAQNGGAVGWTRNSNNQRNRFVLITDLLNTNYQPLRNAIYTYHRLGLDTFTSTPDIARQNVITALKEIQAAKRRSTSNYLYDIFFDTKSREITNIFIDAESKIKLEAYNILKETDQGHLTEYDQLQN